MEVEASAAGALIATNAVLTSLLAGCSQALVSVCESRRQSCSHLSTWNPLIPLSHPGQGHWGPADGLHPHRLSSAQASLSLGRGKDTASLSSLPLSVFLWNHLPMISRRSSPELAEMGHSTPNLSGPSLSKQHSLVGALNMVLGSQGNGSTGKGASLKACTISGTHVMEELPKDVL